jgi:hypothetical protein
LDIGFWIFIGMLIVNTIIFIITRQRRKRFSVPTSDQKKEKINREDLKEIDSPELAEAAAKRVFPDQDQEAILRMFKQFKFRFSPIGGFHTRPEPSDIECLVHRVFHAQDVNSVLLELAKYGKRAIEKTEKERIHLDIIRLSNGDSSRVRALVRQAKTDFRDTIHAAEWPNQYAFTFANPRDSP